MRLCHHTATFQPALFMAIRREIAQSPGETGARRREEGRHT